MFKMPNAVKITGRSSTLTNSFVNGIIPIFQPTREEIAEALSVLGMAEDDPSCIYCGDRATEWDHLRPLVKGKRPTGYVSEIANLVPACGKCNQSKGGAYWRDWMLGDAKLSPWTRGIPDIAARIERLEAFEAWRAPRCVDFEGIAGGVLWATHWENHARLMELLTECQLTAEEIRLTVKAASASPSAPSRAAKKVRSFKEPTTIDDQFLKLGRIELWATRPNQLNHQLIRAFLLLEKDGEVLRSRMKQFCEQELGISTFDSTYASLKTDAANAHGKVFRDDGIAISMWPRAREEVNRYF